jgi:hypothetical protein
MVDIPKRMTEKSGVNLSSWIQPHIYRQPPSSIWTRKKERVTEADTLWMIRPDGPSSDPTRINEAISYFAKGINPSVEVSYQNYQAGGSKTTSMPVRHAGSIYKTEVVRPPLYPAESLLPISRPRIHQTKAVETVPGLPGGVANNTIAYDYDKEGVINAVNQSRSGGPSSIPATAQYKIDAPSVMSAKWAINETIPSAYNVLANPTVPTNVDADNYVCREETPYGVIIRPKYNVTSNPEGTKSYDRNDDASTYAKKEILLKNIKPNFQVVLYDPSNHIATEVSANIREKTNIAVQASLGMPITLSKQDGSQIKLKDYNWTAVQTNVGTDQIILSIENPTIELERNVPLYAMETTATFPTDLSQMKNQDYDLERKLFTNPAGNNIDLSTIYANDNARALQGLTRLPNTIDYGSYDNPSTIPLQFARDIPTLKDYERSQQASRQAYERGMW